MLWIKTQYSLKQAYADAVLQLQEAQNKSDSKARAFTNPEEFDNYRKSTTPTRQEALAIYGTDKGDFPLVLIETSSHEKELLLREKPRDLLRLDQQERK